MIFGIDALNPIQVSAMDIDPEKINCNRGSMKQAVRRKLFK
jgi:predicted RNA methylase